MSVVFSWCSIGARSIRVWSEYDPTNTPNVFFTGKFLTKILNRTIETKRIRPVLDFEKVLVGPKWCVYRWALDFSRLAASEELEIWTPATQEAPNLLRFLKDSSYKLNWLNFELHRSWRVVAAAAQTSANAKQRSASESPTSANQSNCFEFLWTAAVAAAPKCSREGSRESSQSNGQS